MHNIGWCSACCMRASCWYKCMPLIFIDNQFLLIYCITDLSQRMECVHVAWEPWTYVTLCGWVVKPQEAPPHWTWPKLGSCSKRWKRESSPQQVASRLVSKSAATWGCQEVWWNSSGLEHHFCWRRCCRTVRETVEYCIVIVQPGVQLNHSTTKDFM